MQVVDLNNVLPQRLDGNTSFDSAGHGSNQLHYYYSISNLTKRDFDERQVSNSLNSEAVRRLLCALWRPLYMQGVKVTFRYYRSDGPELLHFFTETGSLSFVNLLLNPGIKLVYTILSYPIPIGYMPLMQLNILFLRIPSHFKSGIVSTSCLWQ